MWIYMSIKITAHSTTFYGACFGMFTNWALNPNYDRSSSDLHKLCFNSNIFCVEINMKRSVSLESCNLRITRRYHAVTSFHEPTEMMIWFSCMISFLSIILITFLKRLASDMEDNGSYNFFYFHMAATQQLRRGWRQRMYLSYEILIHKTL